MLKLVKSATKINNSVNMHFIFVLIVTYQIKPIVLYDKLMSQLIQKRGSSGPSFLLNVKLH